VAVASFSVHVAVLRNTAWVGKFLEGKSKVKAAANDATTVPGSGATATVTFSGGTGSDVVQEATIVLPDGRTGKVVFSPPSGGPDTKPTTTAMASDVLTPN
jgi:hypothetical protein